MWQFLREALVSSKARKKRQKGRPNPKTSLSFSSLLALILSAHLAQAADVLFTLMKPFATTTSFEVTGIDSFIESDISDGRMAIVGSYEDTL